MSLIFKRESLDDYSLDKLIELQNEVYKGRYHFTKEIFKFWYVENPLGKAYSYSAYDGDKMVANYSCIPTELSLYGKHLYGLHSMGVVTHQRYQGQGLFRKLAELTHQAAKQDGLDFIIAVSNANSTPGFIKHLGFQLICPLEVKWGWGKIICDKSSKSMYKIYSSEVLGWRLKHSKYTCLHNNLYGKYGLNFGIKTFMGCLDLDQYNNLNVTKSHNCFSPLNLYIGLGADLSKGYYFNFPKFIKHSPFNLIFKPLRDSINTHIMKEDVFFQLIDFDVV